MPRADRPREIAPATLLAEVWRLDAEPTAWIEDPSATGHAFARLATSRGTFFLRRFPTGVAGPWLAAIHDALEYLQRRGFTLFPPFLETESGETLVRHTGHWYDLTPWASGETVAASDLTDARLVSLGGAIGRLHVVGAAAPGPPVRFDWLSGTVATRQRLAWDPVPRGRDPWQRVSNLRAFFEPLAEPDSPTRADPQARAVVEVALATLRWLGSDASVDILAREPFTLTHGDLWADHLRFVATEVSAVLDLDTLALRPPAGDLAALCADFGGWDLDRCRAILDGYRQHRPVAVASLAALPHLGALRTLGVLRERLRAWLDPARRGTVAASLAGPVPFWCEQLRILAALEGDAFARL